MGNPYRTLASVPLRATPLRFCTNGYCMRDGVMWLKDPPVTFLCWPCFVEAYERRALAGRSE